MNALVAFEAAARHESFTRAAEELCVTQGAVSHQVKALEVELGVKLFMRLPQRLSLTVAGIEYFVVAREALDRVASGTDQLLKRQSSGVLTVSTSPNFAAKWLVHRLGRFTDLFPDIDLRLSATKRHMDFAREDLDIAIRHGDGSEKGLSITKLYTERLFPVCSPDLMRGRQSLKKLENLAHHNLLHLDDRQDWSKWLEAACVEAIDLTRGPIFDQASMVIDAAVAGQGVGLARSGLAAHDLLNGRLVQPFKQSLRVNYAYWIVCPKSTADLPKIKLFRDWLLSEAEKDMRLLKIG
jgi:LysR family glycine cleavage system transcriptional activator